MNNFDYLLELLEKKDLTAEEKQSLSRILESDKEARDFYSVYNRIKISLDKAGHIPFDVISEYVMFKNGNIDINNQIRRQVPGIEKHLRECSKCNNFFLEFNEEYSSVDSFISEYLPVKEEISNATGKKLTVDKQETVWSLFNWKSRYLRIALSSILIMGLIYSGLYVISSLNVPATYKYASLDAKTDFYITRGRISPEFQQSVLAIQNGDYESAIRFLNNDIHINNSDETIFYTYYILGLTYLESAESNFLGLFPSYKKEKVLMGIGSLKEAIKKNNSGSYPNINYDAYYFIGKANLMINKLQEAKKYLQLVVENKGSKLEESREILQKLRY